MSTHSPSPSLLRAPALARRPAGLGDLIGRRRKLMQQGLYSPLGKLEKVMIEAGTIAQVKNNPLVSASRRRNGFQTPALDWYGTGPLLAQNGDELLVVEPMRQPPKLPDPEWAPDPAWAVGWHRRSAEAAREGKSFREPFPAAPQPPQIAQQLEHRAAGVLVAGRRRWLVFYPVNERLRGREAAMIFLSRDAGGWGEVKVFADFNGRHMALLYHPHSGEAHFVFGRLVVDFYTQGGR